jgi:hypothetical protein
MEHIVQFAVGIDDNKITALVEQNAEKEIIKDLKQDVANKLFKKDYYRKNADPKTDCLSYFSEQLVIGMLEENKEYILDKAATLLANKLARTKKGKEILDKL